MSSRLAASLAAVAFFIAAQPTLGSDPSVPPASWTVSFKGFGRVSVGSTVRDAEEALHMPLHEDPVSDPAECHYASNEALLPGLAFMIIDGKIVRVDVFKGTHEAVGGLRIGATEADIKRRYPETKTEPHPYDDSGHYLRIMSKDRAYGIIVETDGHVATSYRAGTARAISLIEGCS